MRVIIAGSRSFSDYQKLKSVCDLALRNHSEVTVMSGTASGADKLGEAYANAKGFKIERHPADWNTYGKAAGPIRNAQMADSADMLIAFWDRKSRGTKNMIDIAEATGLQVKTIYFQ